MKNFFKRIGDYGFWVSLSAAVVILLNAFGKAFGFEIENQVVEDCIMAVAGLLVVLGFVSMNVSASDKKTGRDNENFDNLQVGEIEEENQTDDDKEDGKKQK